MRYEKVVCWGNKPKFQKMVSEEFTSSEIVLVSSLDDFKKEITDSSLNLICSAVLSEFPGHELTAKVEDFIRSRPDMIFDIVAFEDLRENVGLCCSDLFNEKNAKIHPIKVNYSGTLNAALQFSFKDY